MEFKYDFTDGNTNIVCIPDENIIPDKEIIKKINDSVFLLNVRVRTGSKNIFYYDVEGKTNYLAWKSEASPKERREMEEKIREATECCARIGIPMRGIVFESKYMYVDDERGIINFICIPENAVSVKSMAYDGEETTVRASKKMVSEEIKKTTGKEPEKDPMNTYFTPAKDL